ncbi:RdgB/HAM1 family non-canonical purine NTP pyrophosphatase [Gracilimonas sp.]|uniref:RdgB/HAM1 family non-canonical purine NTP pyrophosphatase n=1 Tax=Gracilimonas sp. TaxID=1974203 RepID=UPI002871B960|nr:RdgB/HAM1 family non-canonical purine NTP pyrophosphatase [Gracilimonas sp.]
MNIDRLVLASRNVHKIEEMKQILEPLGIEVLSTQDFPELEEVEEDQPTLEGNALKKAKYVAGETNLPALSDDTGLEVEVLGGRPGVYSARYAGEKASYQDNVDKLLDELKNEAKRSAQFRTVVAFFIEGKEFTFEGVCKGRIIKKQKGNKGFGYDPVFKPTGFDKTFAELASAVKNEISHRGKAIKKFTEFIS